MEEEAKQTEEKLREEVARLTRRLEDERQRVAEARVSMMQFVSLLLLLVQLDIPNESFSPF